MKKGGRSGRRNKGKQLSEKELYKEAVFAMERGVELLKTKVAFYKLSGRGTEFDPEGAVPLLEDRAEKGDGEALWMLGVCCEYGIGMERDTVRAELLYYQSCQTKNVVGTFLSKNNGGGRGTGTMLTSWGLYNKHNISV